MSSGRGAPWSRGQLLKRMWLNNIGYGKTVIDVDFGSTLIFEVDQRTKWQKSLEKLVKDGDKCLNVPHKSFRLVT